MNVPAQPKPSGNFFKLKVPAHYLIVSYGLCLLILLWQRFSFSKSSETGQPTPITVINECATNMKQVRLADQKYHLTRPLLLTDIPEESKEMLPLKQQVNAFIQDKIGRGIITDASVYLRKLNDGTWINYNPGKTFTPGSLMKVPAMITYLKQSETEPGLLDRTIYFDPASVKQMPAQTFNTNEIQPGKNYTVRELIYQTIVNSDNRSTFLLNAHVNIPAFYKLFADLGFPTPDLTDRNYQITSADYSKFIRVLYNSSYLNKQNSEYALDLLSRSSFKEGIIKDLPPGMTIAHKFGEYGNPSGNFKKQLHESGIVYLDNSPYLITIFTGGTKTEDLPPVISGLSRIIYNYMAASKKAEGVI